MKLVKICKLTRSMSCVNHTLHGSESTASVPSRPPFHRSNRPCWGSRSPSLGFLDLFPEGWKFWIRTSYDKEKEQDHWYLQRSLPVMHVESSAWIWGLQFVTCNNLLSKHRVERIWFEVFLIVIFLLSKGHNDIGVSLPGLKKQKVYELNTTRDSCKSKPSKRIRTKKKTSSQYCGKFVSMSLDNDDHDENKNNNATTRTITKTTTPAKATTVTLTNPLGSWGWRSVAYVEKNRNFKLFLQLMYCGKQRTADPKEQKMKIPKKQRWMTVSFFCEEHINSTKPNTFHQRE